MLVPEAIKIYLRLEYTDMRKSIDTLAVLVSDALSLDPGSGHLFLFRNRRNDKLKALYYERNCFTLIYRRLEKGKFIFPKHAQGSHIEITHTHFQWLLASDKFSSMPEDTDNDYKDYY